MVDDSPRRSRATTTAASRAACASPTAPPKPAYLAFRLPLTADDYGSSDVLWGRVRPAAGPADLRPARGQAQSGKWRELATVQTNSTGVFGARTKHVDGQRYRVVLDLPRGDALHRAADPRLLSLEAERRSQLAAAVRSPPWPRNCGSCGMATPCPTGRSPTPSAS